MHRAVEQPIVILRTGAKVLIRRASDGKYLILTSSIWEDHPLRSQQPDLPGGRIEDGEMIEEGLRRELSEEIGSDLPGIELQLAYASTHVDTKAEESVTFLLYFATVENLEVVLSWEHESFDWMSADDVVALEIREPFSMIFTHFKTIGLLV